MSITRNLLVAALMMSAGHALAASSVDLSVKGTITPSACTPALGNGGQFEVGKIAAKDLKVNDYTILSDHFTQVTVTCEAPTLMAIEPRDNRAGSEAMGEPVYFGLGLINGDEKLGSLSILLEQVMADGVASRAIDSLDGGTTWERHFSIGPDRITSVANVGTLTPIPVQAFSARMSLTPIIAPTSGLTLTEEVPIDGSATLTVRYL
ncbi:DUF1120 domain-containing protein [Pseudomonas sp. SDO5271_S396]